MLKKLVAYISSRLLLPTEWKRQAKAEDMAFFLWDFQQYLRAQNKYGDPPDEIETIYEKWFEMLSDHGIILDDLTE